MKDNDIKNKLDQSLSNYEIKTTSNDILNGYYSSLEEEKAPKHHFGFLKFALPTLVLAGTITGLVLIPSIHTGIDPTPTVPLLNSKKNQTAFSIFSGMNIISNLDSSSSIHGLTLKRAFLDNVLTIEDEDDEEDKDNENDEVENEDSENHKEEIVQISFEQMMNTFDPCVDVITSLLETSINVESTLLEGEFVGQYGTYPYKLEVYDYVLYTNISLDEEDDEDETETTYLGEVVMSDSLSYKVEMNIEEEIDDGEKEQEINTKIIYSDSSYLKIEQENELDERSYKYTLYEDEKKVYQEKISFEDEQEKNDFIDVRVLKDGIIYNYEDISKNENGLKGNYFLDEDDGNVSTFQMQEEATKRIYTNNLSEKVEILK